MSKQIELTQGKVAIVDDEIYEKLICHNWIAQNNHGCWYAFYEPKKGRKERRHINMHYVILNISLSKFVDHINDDTLDYRKENLRECTKAEYIRKKKITKANTSGFKGVSKDNSGKWTANIWVNGKQKYLGRYYSKKEAALAYDQAAKEYFGEFARLNFPEA